MQHRRITPAVARCELEAAPGRLFYCAPSQATIADRTGLSVRENLESDFPLKSRLTGEWSESDHDVLDNDNILDNDDGFDGARRIGRDLL
jgi:hypothetical protein